MLESRSRPGSLYITQWDFTVPYTDGVDRDFGLLSLGSTKTGPSLVILFEHVCWYSCFQLSTAALKIFNCYISCCLVWFKTVIQSTVIRKLSTNLSTILQSWTVSVWGEREKRTGPIADPCGTPHVRWVFWRFLLPFMTIDQIFDHYCHFGVAWHSKEDSGDKNKQTKTVHTHTHVYIRLDTL